MRKKASFFNVKRPFVERIRWSANLFQQKWASKAMARAYHGETVREKQWKRQFNPTLRSVVPMSPEQLARTDGSEYSAGRGSGLSPREKDMTRKEVPHTSMVFAALERRLDVALHRAMFASSTRQARQFIIHGFVKVNGREMIYPGYQLNPGDMFQVEPDRVLYATGLPKDAAERRAARRERKSLQAEANAEDTIDADAAEEVTTDTDSSSPESSADALKAILEHARNLLATEKDDASAKRKRLLRELQRTVRKALSKGKQNVPIEEAVDEQMLMLMKKLNLTEKDDQGSENADQENGDAASPEDSTQQWLSPSQKRELEQALQELKENPVDLSKSYATPWQPRPYMAPFAFIPRYLEVHHKICSAIYLRHPVARPGISEVPSPFGVETSRLAFNWYLKNR